MFAPRKFLSGSLYSKIFVWYWFAMAIVGLVVLIVVAVTQPDSNSRVQRARLEEVLDISGTTAAEDFTRRGPRAVMTYFNRLKRSERRRRDGNLKLWLFNANGLEISGQEVPVRVRSLVKPMVAQQKTSATNPDFEIQWAQVNEAVTGARWTEDGRAHFFIFVADLGNATPRDPWTRVVRILRAPWPTQVLRSLVVLFTTGLICLLLARHLTSPISQLQSTARRLASGELEARMGPALENRRDELAILARDFDHMADQLQSLLLSQTRLLGDISHELRSPLARLNVAHDLALHHAATGEIDELDEDLQRIGSETQRLDSLIEQLLTLSRLESGTQHRQMKPIDLDALLQNVAQDADFEAQSLGKRVEILQCDACIINGDESLLRSAIENIVRNAMRYTAQDTAVQITLHCPAGGQKAIVTVRDHGPGVPSEELTNLFRPFYRLTDARERQNGGAGLGLSITQRAVSAHNGTVQARNAQGGGLEVEVCLPI